MRVERGFAAIHIKCEAGCRGRPSVKTHIDLDTKRNDPLSDPREIVGVLTDNSNAEIAFARHDFPDVDHAGNIEDALGHLFAVTVSRTTDVMIGQPSLDFLIMVNLIRISTHGATPTIITVIFNE